MHLKSPNERKGERKRKINRERERERERLDSLISSFVNETS